MRELWLWLCLLWARLMAWVNRRKTTAWACMVLGAVLLLIAQAAAPEDPTSLGSLLTWIIFQGGAGLIAYGILELLPLDNWGPDHKRYLSFAVSGALGILAQLTRYAIGHAEVPVGVVAWVEELWSIFMTATGGASIFHAIFQLRAKRLSGHGDPKKLE